MRTKLQINTRVTPVTIERIAAIAQKLRISKTAVVEESVKEKATREKVKP